LYFTLSKFLAEIPLDYGGDNTYTNCSLCDSENYLCSNEGKQRASLETIQIHTNGKILQLKRYLHITVRNNDKFSFFHLNA
jgi:hypothetical protein